MMQRDRVSCADAGVAPAIRPTGRLVAMNTRMGFVVVVAFVALTVPATSAPAAGPRSALCNTLQKSVAEVTGLALTKVSSWDTKGQPLRCIYAPQTGTNRFYFELPDGDAKKLAEWHASFAKSSNKTTTALTDLPELGAGAFRANSGGIILVHGLAKKQLLVVGGTAKPDVEVQLWKRIASGL
jgi:hypothetical protein